MYHRIQYQRKEKHKQIKAPGECFNLHEIQMGSAFDFAFYIMNKCLYVLYPYKMEYRKPFLYFHAFKMLKTEAN